MVSFILGCRKYLVAYRLARQSFSSAGQRVFSGGPSSSAASGGSSARCSSCSGFGVSGMRSTTESHLSWTAGLFLGSVWKSFLFTRSALADAIFLFLARGVVLANLALAWGATRLLHAILSGGRYWFVAPPRLAPGVCEARGWLPLRGKTWHGAAWSHA
jgi:hypothetical protein